MPAFHGRNKKPGLTPPLSRVRLMRCVLPIATTGEWMHGAGHLIAVQAVNLLRRPWCIQSSHVDAPIPSHEDLKYRLSQHHSMLRKWSVAMWLEPP